MLQGPALLGVSKTPKGNTAVHLKTVSQDTADSVPWLTTNSYFQGRFT